MNYNTILINPFTAPCCSLNVGVRTVRTQDTSDLGYIGPETKSNTKPNPNPNTNPNPNSLTLFPKRNFKVMKLVTDARFQTPTKRSDVS